MKQNDTAIIFVVFLATAIVTAIFFLSMITERAPELTGMSPSQIGIAIISFNVTPPPPPPPPPKGGGSSAGRQAECCNQTFYEGVEYTCSCFINEYGTLRVQPLKCCDNPTDDRCLDFCRPAEKPKKEVPSTPTCPTERTCGPKCCKTSEYCRNGQCMPILPAPSAELPPPPEIEEPTLVTIPYTEYAFPWWYFVLAIVILLSLSYLLLRKTHKKTYTPPKQAPEQPKPVITAPAKRTKRHKRHKRK